MSNLGNLNAREVLGMADRWRAEAEQCESLAELFRSDTASLATVSCPGYDSLPVPPAVLNDFIGELANRFSFAVHQAELLEARVQVVAS